MRIKYFLILLFATLSNFVSAQQIEIGNYGITGGTWNANNTFLLIKRDINTVFQTNLFITRSTLPDIVSRPVKVEARVIFINKLDQDWAIVSPVVNFTTSDFPGTSGATPVKSVTTTIPKNFLYSPAEGELLMQWRYYKDGYPAPDQVNGWTNWYQTKLKINCQLEPLIIPPTTFSGPSSVCSDETYTITNPGTISLQNATGIATLTTLGNNQWKVTKVNNGSGSVILRSIDVNGLATDKNITIGTVTSGTISGQASLQLGESRSFTLNLLDNTDYIWSISYNPNVVMTKNSATSITLSTTGSVPMGWSENIIIRAKAVSNCGTATNEVTKTIKFVNERDPRLD